MNLADPVVKRHMPVLWSLTGLLIAFNLWVGLIGRGQLIEVSLALTGGFALYGIGFCLWAVRRMHRSAR
jgi:hypothetical protein